MTRAPLRRTHNRVAKSVSTRDAARTILDERSEWKVVTSRRDWGCKLKCIKHANCLATAAYTLDEYGKYDVWESLQQHSAGIASRQGRKRLLNSKLQRRCDKNIARFAPTPEQVCTSMYTHATSMQHVCMNLRHVQQHAGVCVVDAVA